MLVDSRIRRQVRAFTAVFSGLIVCLSIGSFCLPTHVHYRLFKDRVSLNAVMKEHDQQDSTINDYRGLLGSGVVITAQEKQRHVSTIETATKQFPHAFPQGAQATDEFLAYDLSDAVIYLQFRAGRLINTPRTVSRKNRVTSVMDHFR